MKTKFVILLAAALALMLSVPTGANAVGLGKTCEGIAGLRCDAGLFCEHKPGECGWFHGADQSGRCARIPRFCSQITSPKLEVCGCNGQTYFNDCKRQQAEVSLAHRGKCQ
ncbi:MAG TPA: Kazal-type serine protease inhibitor [Bradyrhizobium sp.]|jgi:hypothetical protein|uniref:Kazal-type serine protease inhibitor family protein n=1 Tax=Bradyrhizobium sp. TaxID=376 RepID=UPI002BD7DC7C|nr:Kazal-type serine protease inhibitor [Bradyrhizobium sp.]HTB00341.1 Kazal-type serine protease inhibitor [Bradyrhizobium sp.]